MIWPFTALGVVAGALLANIPGAMLGGVLGQVVDRRLQLPSWAALRTLLLRTEPASDELLFMLLGRLAKSTGVVVPAHIQQARDEMQRLALDASAQKKAIAAFNRGKVGDQSFRAPLKKLAASEQAERLLRACWRMAWADQSVAAAERELLNLWGQWLGFSISQVSAIGERYAPQAKRVSPKADATRYRAALRLLGVSESVDKASLKRAYRRLVSQHHPDKLTGKGASAERIRRSTQTTSELHQAYQCICQYRGF